MQDFACMDCGHVMGDKKTIEDDIFESEMIRIKCRDMFWKKPYLVTQFLGNAGVWPRYKENND